MSQVYQCGRKADGDLCEKCLERPREGKYQTRILHGLVTEPIPLVSHLYGSPVYWQKMKKFEEAGKVLSLDGKAWIEAAEEAQAQTEKEGGWKVQRPSAKEVEKEMRKAASSKAKAKNASTAVKPTAQNLKEIFKPVKVRFKEVDKPPVKMETDSIDVCKMVIGEVSVFIVDELVFDTDGDKIGDHIGYYRGEEFFEL